MSKSKYEYRNNITMVIYYIKRVGFEEFKKIFRFLVDDGFFSKEDLEVIKNAVEKAKRKDIGIEKK